MRTILSEKLEQGRIRTGHYASNTGDLHGAFIVIGPTSTDLKIMSSGIDNHYGWEHVSISCPQRTPNWLEMCFVKDLFWHEEECVMQLHPPRSEYINCHPYCLHLWRPLRTTIPTPPSLLVG
jgi:hypothetical protein